MLLINLLILINKLHIITQENLDEHFKAINIFILDQNVLCKNNMKIRRKFIYPIYLSIIHIFDLSFLFVDTN